MKYTYRDAITIVNTIEAQKYELNDWETKFIDSILSQKKDLSIKQSECLMEIYAKSTNGGHFQTRQYFR